MFFDVFFLFYFTNGSFWMQFVSKERGKDYSWPQADCLLQAMLTKRLQCFLFGRFNSRLFFYASIPSSYFKNTCYWSTQPGEIYLSAFIQIVLSSISSVKCSNLLDNTFLNSMLYCIMYQQYLECLAKLTLYSFFIRVWHQNSKELGT